MNPSLHQFRDHLSERVAQVKRTDAYSRPRWTLADVEAVDALLAQIDGCPVCSQDAPGPTWRKP